MFYSVSSLPLPVTLRSYSRRTETQIETGLRHNVKPGGLAQDRSQHNRHPNSSDRTQQRTRSTLRMDMEQETQHDPQTRGKRAIKISYKPLWKLLIDKDMKKKDLCAKAGISPASVTKMGRNGHVTTEILVKICATLDCGIGDIMEIVPGETD